MASSRNSRSTDPGAALAGALDAHVPRGARLCVALSGGVDSVLLLHLLADLAKNRHLVLCACHVHHGLSADADHWAAFCTDLCRVLDVPLTVARVTVAAGHPAGIEGAAREARYAALAQASRRFDAAWVVTAHHRDDQAETLLLNLLRGAGVHGAAAMPQVRSLGEIASGAPIHLLRPLLHVTRAELLRRAQARGLRWVDDESNADGAFGRNFLRHQILPMLERRWPGSGANLARAAGHFSEAAGLLDALARADLAQAPALDVPGARRALDLRVLNGLDDARARNLLRYWLRGAGVSAPPAGQLHECLRQVREGGDTATPEIRIGDWLLVRYRNALALLPRDDLPLASVPWQGEAVLPWGRGEVRFASARGAGLMLEGLAAELRCRRPGDRFRPRPGAASRSLKNLLQEAGVPPVLRTRLPVLARGDEVLWLPFVGMAGAHEAASDQFGVLPAWQVSSCD